MALIPATLTVNFTANYVGQHRVCWRTGGSGPYDCTTIVSCGGPSGSTCSASISIMVDQESCDEVVFDGYVQAICEDEDSDEGQLPFNITFTPNPTCVSYEIECTTVGVASITVTNPGNTYTVGSNPGLLFSGGGGAGATGIATIGDGGVKTWTITNGGVGYNGGGSAVFTNVLANTLTGTGSGAIFNVTVTTGVVTSISLSSLSGSPGTGYVVNDTFEFLAAGLGGTGSGSIITVNSLNTGEVEYITLTSPGTGYTSTPLITIAGPDGGGATATAIAIMAPCEPLDYGNDCDGDDKGTIDNIELGQSFNTCYEGIPPALPDGFSIEPSGCCYDCVSVTITKPDSPDQTAILTYTTCEGETVHVAMTETFALTDCMVNNSWIVTSDTGTTNIVTGAACP